MAKLYRKTEKGVSEMATRAHRLSPRLRAALILVDGKRSEAELQSIILSEPEETLRWLSESGFIEAAANTSVWQESAQSAAPSQPLATGTLAKPTKQGDTRLMTRAPMTLLVPIEQLKRESVRFLNDTMGPMAESLAVKIEKARWAEELQQLLSTTHGVIGNMRGASKAAEFHARFLAEATWAAGVDTLAPTVQAESVLAPGAPAREQSSREQARVNAQDMRRSPSPQDNPPPASRMPIEQIKRESVRFLSDCAGPMGDTLAMKIEKARSREELLPLLTMAHQTISHTRGAAKAADFHTKYVNGMMV
jgi:hypothetical protein